VRRTQVGDLLIEALAAFVGDEGGALCFRASDARRSPDGAPARRTTSSPVQLLVSPRIVFGPSS
jgi:hypothetical protein